MLGWKEQVGGSGLQPQHQDEKDLEKGSEAALGKDSQTWFPKLVSKQNPCLITGLETRFSGSPLGRYCDWSRLGGYWAAG